jgi:hypothetical protein
MAEEVEIIVKQLD